MLDKSRVGATSHASLDALLSPRSVAVIGASSDPSRIGGRPIDYYNRAGFKGALYPVNPSRKEIQGRKAYPDIASIPDDVDFALLAIPAQAIPAQIDACGAKGVKVALVFSAGFAEVGAEGAALQDEIMRRADANGIRILGPNCLGLFNATTGHCPTFSSALQEAMPVPGRVGMVTQSGAYGTHLLNMARARRINVGTWISTGNEADITVSECLLHLIESDEIDAVACYMEAVNDRERFLHALARARELAKPVTIMKVGVSEIGAAAAQSHTASLAGSDESFDAVLRRFGIPRARTTEEMLDILYAGSIAPLPKGRKLGILTVSGGAGVLMADAAEEAGLSTPPMPEAAQVAMKARNPLCSPRNPIDITAHALNDFSLVTENLHSMSVDGGYDMLVSFFTSWTASPVLGPRVREAIIGGIEGEPAKPVALVCQGSDEVLASYEDKGVMTFEDPSRAIRALGHLARFAEAVRQADQPGPMPEMDAGIRLPAGVVSEHEAKALLAKAGISVLSEELVRTPDEAAKAAGRLGLPVAIKIVSPDIAHKSEVGGVMLGLADGEAVHAATEAMLGSVRCKAPDARIDGVLVSPMAGEGVELVVGVRNDPVMGALVLVGLGGIFVEVLKDVVLDLAPVSIPRAREMIEHLKGAALLCGVRGQPAVDIDAAAEVVSRLSLLAAQNQDAFDSIEINPLLVRIRGAVALDALIVPAASKAKQ